MRQWHWQDPVCDKLYLMHGEADRAETRRQVDLLERTCMVEPGQKIMDAGCGSGRVAVEFALRGYEVTAVDCSEFFIERAAKKARQAGAFVRHVCCSLADLSVGESYDLIVWVEAAVHYYPPSVVLGMIRRMADHLCLGGRLALWTASPEQILRDVDDTTGAGTTVSAGQWLRQKVVKDGEEDGVPRVAVHLTLVDGIAGRQEKVTGPLWLYPEHVLAGLVVEGGLHPTDLSPPTLAAASRLGEDILLIADKKRRQESCKP
jgi:SAM-dependent methyltransferase